MHGLGAQQARNLHLAAQGLLAPPRRRARKEDVFDAIARMRVLQIDTIHVVARSPYLVLYSRLGRYAPQWLDELLDEGRIFECWAHEACFAPFVDHDLHRFHAGRRAHWSMRSAARARDAHADGMARLLEHIRANGAVKASEFERKDGAGGGWWGWKDEKRWLEALFAHGELMIARRENFQRVYDLAERVRAKALRLARPEPVDDEATMRRAFVLGAVRALGVTQSRWVNDYFRSGGKLKDAELDRWVDTGELLRVEVDGWDKPGYVHAAHADLLAQAAQGRLRATRSVLLSPFDPVVWDRERASTMFGFDYRIECYVPAPKRRFGYYVLPILHRGRLVGRLDAKAHRVDGVFEVKALHLEAGVQAGESLLDALATAILDCADWHATPRVSLGRCEPATARVPLRAALAAHARA
ncbi:winged helix-turn-helix domain-containing protein [Dokdonella sp.]|uniref:winged helix-turn-helix domain-containing protein n=1 Tax=Dokdonella sp. TaxID=2291710 RepID=UPI002F418F9C